jgi:anaerobic selenocysteine-containing dehydrogenase
MIPWLREKRPDPLVEIHPDTAKKYGIYEGEWIYLENDMGRIKRKAKITRIVQRTHVQTEHGWWMPEMNGKEPDLFGVWDYQVNKIIPGPQCSKSGFGGGQYKTTLIKLSKMTN